jgi:hypothetical protein
MKRLAIVALISGLASSAALADVVNVGSLVYPDDWNLKFNITAPAGSENGVVGGLMQGTLNSQSFLTYCVDIFQNIYLGTTYSDFTLVSAGDTQLPWFTASKATDLAHLFTGYAAQVKDAVSSSAFQLATWAIISETGSSYAISGNGFSATAADAASTPNGANEALALNTADTWLHSLPGYSNYKINVEYSPIEQDLVIASKVPEPPAYVLGATAFALLGLSRRRNLKATA